MTRERRRRIAVESLEGRELLSFDPGGRARPPRLAPAEVRSERSSIRFQPTLYQASGGRLERIDLYIPSGPEPTGGRPVILGFPGGGWREANRGFLGAQMASFAERGYLAASVDVAYASNRAGTRIWPMNLEDARQAVRWVRSNANRLGVNPSKIAVLGQSAGGHLAALVGTSPDTPLSDEGLPVTERPAPRVSAQVQAVVTMYAPTDLNMLYQQGRAVRPFLETFLGGSPSSVPGRYQAASPVAQVTPGDAPFLILQGAGDPTVRPSQAIALGERLRENGVPARVIVYPRIGHGFSIRGRNRDSFQEILTFLDRAMNQGGQGI